MIIPILRSFDEAWIWGFYLDDSGDREGTS